MKGSVVVATALFLGACITGCNTHQSSTSNTVYGSTAPAQGAIQALNRVSYGHGVFVAAGSGGAGSGSGNTIGAWVETSTDGVNWAVQDSGDGSDAGGDYSDLAYGSGGFIAVDVTDGHTFISTNGVHWTDNTPSAASDIQQVEWDGTEYIIPVAAGFLVSKDGLTWTSIKLSPGATPAWPIVKVGSQWYAIIDDGSAGNTIGSSKNLISWTPISGAPVASAFNQLIYAGGRFVVTGVNGLIATSTDGSSWTASTAVTTEDLLGVAYNGTSYVAMGGHGTIAYSNDGTTWTNVDISSQLPPLSTTSNGTTTSGFEFTSITAAPNGAFVIIGGTPVRSVTSMDGIHWTIGKP